MPEGTSKLRAGSSWCRSPFTHSFIHPVSVYRASPQGQAPCRTLEIQQQTRHSPYSQGSQGLEWESGQRAADHLVLSLAITGTQEGSDSLGWPFRAALKSPCQRGSVRSCLALAPIYLHVGKLKPLHEGLCWG